MDEDEYLERLFASPAKFFKISSKTGVGRGFTRMSKKGPIKNLEELHNRYKSTNRISEGAHKDLELKRHVARQKARLKGGFYKGDPNESMMKVFYGVK